MEDRISIYGLPVYSFTEDIAENIDDGETGYIVHPDVIDALKAAYSLAKRQHKHFIEVCDLFTRG